MAGRLKEVLAFVNNKGGVGKTTTVQNVATGLLRMHPEYRIMVIDLDPQCNLSSLMGWRDLQKKFDRWHTVADALRDGDRNSLPVYRCDNGIYLCPASEQLVDIDTALHAQMSSKQVLSSLFGNTLDFEDELQLKDDEVLNYIEDDFDYVLIDCPPALGELTYNALAAATGVVIPVQLASLSVDGLGRMIDACRKVKRKLNPDLELRGLLISMADERLNVAKETTDYLRQTFTDMVFQTRIRRCTEVEKCQYQPTDIFAWDAACAAAKDYDSFIHELINSSIH